MLDVIGAIRVRATPRPNTAISINKKSGLRFTITVSFYMEAKMRAVRSVQTCLPTLVLVIKLVLLKIVNMSQISGESIAR